MTELKLYSVSTDPKNVKRRLKRSFDALERNLEYLIVKVEEAFPDSKPTSNEDYHRLLRSLNEYKKRVTKMAEYHYQKKKD